MCIHQCLRQICSYACMLVELIDTNQPNVCEEHWQRQLFLQQGSSVGKEIWKVETHAIFIIKYA